MLVIAAKSGQLGNRLLLFANFIAFAIENNLRVINPAFEEYADFFQGTARDFLCCYPPLAITIKGNKFIRSKFYTLARYLTEKGVVKVKQISREKPFNWNNYHDKNELKQRSIFCFKGWLFRDGWFVEDTKKLYDYAPQIRAYFTPLEKYQSHVNTLISNTRHNSDLVIGVHIRQGDYAQHQKGRYFYQTEQYIKVMNSVQNLFVGKNIQFLICSNLKQESSLFEQFNYIFGNNHLIEDMYALAKCDYIIGAPSSYTMWASFYGNKPLYMIRDVHKEVNLNDFVQFYEWKGSFYYRDDWSESFWEWTH